MNKLLSQVIKAFENEYLIACHEDRVLEFSVSKDTLPFALVIYENDHPDIILLSLSVDFHDNNLFADFIINLGYIGKIQLTEGFYLDDEGVCYLGKDAEKEYNKNNNLYDATPISKAIN